MNRSYVFLRMPFGLSNAPRTFQNVMMDMFSDLNFVKIYIDDILIHSKTLYEHFLHVKAVLYILHNNGASINFEKSSFFVDEVDVLGHKISKNGIKANISTVKKWENKYPNTRKELDKLLGFFNWFRSYVMKMSCHTSDLYKKLNTSENLCYRKETKKA
ncbi:Polyprotein P3 [Dictyocoela muelleri]|nr:Polyprotein P3 [Dictyocoela muelleri]